MDDYSDSMNSILSTNNLETKDLSIGNLVIKFFTIMFALILLLLFLCCNLTALSLSLNINKNSKSGKITKYIKVTLAFLFGFVYCLYFKFIYLNSSTKKLNLDKDKLFPF